jgi:pimeloyl-ACP methyl ester carboxylesterase
MEPRERYPEISSMQSMVGVRNQSGGYPAAVTAVLSAAYMASVNYSEISHIDCPILLFEGRHDSTTPSSIAAKWLQRVRAPTKKIVWFEDSAHMIFVEEPGKFLVHLVQDARPLAGN